MKTEKSIRDMFIGLYEEVEYAGGTKVAINFDSAATTPPFTKVAAEIHKQMPMYGSIGRGTGQKSKHSSEIYTNGRNTILDFVGADKGKYTVIYTNSTTDGMNKLASALIESHRDVVLTTRMEHHANDLPWRERARTVYVDVDENGRLNPSDFETILKKHNLYTDYNGNRVFKGTIKYVTVSAASNVTGYMNDVHAIAKIAHEYGAKIIVDCAQIVAHRAFSMKGAAPEEDIDFIVFSAHKMYSPYGGGAIVGLTEVLNARLPVFYGGGMVDKVTDDDVVYSKVSDRYEAGSPNYPGVVGMLKAMDILKNEIGFEYIKKHEEELLRYAIDQLKAIEGWQIILYGDCDNIDDRVGILVFNLKRFKNEEVANYLAWHAAIAVRHAKFCAHTYVDRLLGLTEPKKMAESGESVEAYVAHEGMVRVSFGLFSTKDDVDALVLAVRDMLEGKDTVTLATHMDAASIATLPNDRG